MSNESYELIYMNCFNQ